MAFFKMCPDCYAEYTDPLDRRFHSQTNTCQACRISQWITDRSGRTLEIEEEATVDFICEKISDGETIAVKGIGGFLLVCDAANEHAVRQLRKNKERPTKPFALMYPDIESVHQDFMVSKAERNSLQSIEAPIVLLRPKRASLCNGFQKYIAPGLDRMGVMLPYTPLYVLIAQKLNRPLLATSGNYRGAPITFKNDQAIELLGLFSDYFLLNNREIQVPQDDSVVKFTGKHRRSIMIRRSRGYAPGFLYDDFGQSEEVLAMGALLKSSFAIWHQSRLHISQFLGDTLELDAQVSYERTLNHFRKILQFTPTVILVDKHPAYFSTQLGKELANELEAKLEYIQHHEAHFWAVLGESDLLNQKEKVLGVVLDGTGMGHDGAIWGGEFFSYHQGGMERKYHLDYYPHILGDKMAREPRLSALSVLHHAGCEQLINPEVFTTQELEYYTKVLDHASLSTSSLGRLFDAVSSMLGLCHKNTHEGEAAMYLEKVGQEYFDENHKLPDAYSFEIGEDGAIDLSSAVTEIMNDVNKEESTGMIAVRFHRTVVEIIRRIASEMQVRHIAFSGGVMQNGLLVDMIIDSLREHYNLYFHKDLSPNDECISFGQLVSYGASAKFMRSESQNINFQSIV
jgi:hydrogenase maturation protein HypF